MSLRTPVSCQFVVKITCIDTVLADTGLSQREAQTPRGGQRAAEAPRQRSFLFFRLRPAGAKAFEGLGLSRRAVSLTKHDVLAPRLRYDNQFCKFTACAFGFDRGFVRRKKFEVSVPLLGPSREQHDLVTIRVE